MLFSKGKKVNIFRGLSVLKGHLSRRRQENGKITYTYRVSCVPGIIQKTLLVLIY